MDPPHDCVARRRFVAIEILKVHDGLPQTSTRQRESLQVPNRESQISEDEFETEACIGIYKPITSLYAARVRFSTKRRIAMCF